jgi:hypothetical protein
MPRVAITNRLLNTLKPDNKTYFLRDESLKIFGVKVNTTGSINFIIETWRGGKSKRKTLGQFPLLPLEQARNTALDSLAKLKSGQQIEDVQKRSLEKLFNEYISNWSIEGKDGRRLQRGCVFLSIRMVIQTRILHNQRHGREEILPDPRYSSTMTENHAR